MSLPAYPKPRELENRVKLSAYKYRKLRGDVFYEQQGRCSNCDCRMSLAEMHLHHLRKRGMGGSNRDDSRENVTGLCPICHHAEHTRKP